MGNKGQRLFNPLLLDRKCTVENRIGLDGNRYIFSREKSEVFKFARMNRGFKLEWIKYSEKWDKWYIKLRGKWKTKKYITEAKPNKPQPSYKEIFKHREKFPISVKAYKLEAITRRDSQKKTYRIKSLDLHTVRNFRKFVVERFWPVILSKDEIRMMRISVPKNIKPRMSLQLIRLYILLKSYTNSGQFGLLCQMQFIERLVGSSARSLISLGIERGYWDVYQLARLLKIDWGRYVIYFNKDWKNEQET